MPRQRRKENLGLPKRWQQRHGAYYYLVPPGQEHHWDGKKQFRLGTKINEAYKVWSDRMATDADPDAIKTIAQLLDRYLLEVVPGKKVASQNSNKNQIAKLREVLGALPILPFKPKLVYQYVTRRSVKKKDPETGRTTGGKIAAHREVETLSHAYTKAVEWGLIDRHPFKSEVRLEGEPPRDRYVEDWEVIEMLAMQSKRKKGSVLAIQAYLRIKLLTGMAQGDLLRLQERQLKEDGIHVQRRKTEDSSGKRTIYQWSPELRRAVAMARQARPVDITPFLFCTRDGVGYVDEEKATAAGWKSMWQRFSERVLAETKVTEHFTEHDLRAKVASDAETLERARALLAHADARTTERIYRRRPERVSTGN